MEHANIDDNEQFGADVPPAAATRSRVANYVVVSTGLAPTDRAAQIFYSAASEDPVLAWPRPHLHGSARGLLLFDPAPGSSVGIRATTRFPGSSPASFLHRAPGPFNAAVIPDFLPFITASPLAPQRNQLRSEAAPFAPPQAIAVGSAPMGSRRNQLCADSAQAIGKGGAPLASQHKQLSAEAAPFAPNQAMAQGAYMDMHPEFGLKTVICKYWKEGNCSSGDQCLFAHGEQELVKVDPRTHPMFQADEDIHEAARRANRYKTALCNKWQAADPMACPYGVNCMYAHGPQEVRVEGQMPPVCHFYLAGRPCPRDDGCRYRHHI